MKAEITTNTTEMQNFVREWYEKLYANNRTTGRNGQVPINRKLQPAKSESRRNR